MPQLIALVGYAAGFIPLAAGATVPGLIAAALIEVVAIGFTLYGVAQAANAPSTAPTTGNLDHLRNIARNGNAPERVIYGRAKASGMLVFAQSTDKTGNPNPAPNPANPRARYLHMVLAICAGPIDAFEKIFLNDLLIEDGAYRGRAVALEAHGFRDQPAVRGPFTLGNDLVQLPSEWTEAHCGFGVAYLYMVLKHHPIVFRGGAPQVRAVVRGKRVYDPRLDVSRGGTHVRHDEQTWEWSENPAICLYDYMTNGVYGLRIPPTSIDEAAVMTAADVCDEMVTIPEVTPGVTAQKRYTCNGIFETDGNRLDIVGALKGSMAGDIIYRNGRFFMRAGSPLVDRNGRAPSDPLWEPDFVITDKHLVTALNVSPAPGRESRVNTITGSFINDADDLYEEDSITPVSAPNWVSDDGGTEFATPLDLPFTTGHIRAKRMAQIALRQQRLWAIQGDFSTNFGLMDVAPHALGAITIPDLGWTRKPIVALSTGINQGWGVDLEWREYDEDAWDISADGEDIIDQLPGTDLPSPFTIEAPRAVHAEAFAHINPDGTRGARVLVTWEAPPTMIVRHYLVGYKHRNATVYTETGSPTTSFEFFPNRDGAHNVYVAAVGLTGVPSRKVFTAVTVDYALIPPPDVAGFRIAFYGDQRRFDWQLADAAPADLAGYELRVLGPYPSADAVPTGNPNASWSQAREFAKSVPAYLETSLPTKAGPYLFLVKAFDRSGNYSDNATEIFVEIPRSAQADVLASEEAGQLGWPGRIRNGKISSVGNEIRSLSAQTWGDAVTWADLSTGSDRSIIYDHPEIELPESAVFEPTALFHLRNATARVLCRVRDAGGVYTRYQLLRPGMAGKYIQFRLIADPVDTAKRFAVLAFAMRCTRETNEEIVDNYSPVDDELKAVLRTEQGDPWWRRGDLQNCTPRSGTVTANARALALNGGAYLQQYASAPSHAAYARITNAFTWAFDFRALDIGQTNRTIVCIGDQLHVRWKTVGGGTPTIDVTSTSFTGEAFTAGTATLLTDPRCAVPDNGFAWHRFVVTYDGAVLRTYLDNVLMTEQVVAFALVPTGQDLRIGTNAGLSGFGKFDVRELQLWERALSPDEVGETADGALRGDETGLIGYWKLDGNGTDLSPTGNDIVLAAVSGNPGDLPGYVRTGSRFSPPYDMSVPGRLALPAVVSWDGEIDANESITVHVSTDGGATWSAISASGTQLLAADVDYSGSRILCRQVLRSTVNSTPNLGRVTIGTFRRQVVGDYVYTPQVAFGHVDQATITAVQGLPIGAQVTPAVVAKANFGVRYKLARSDNLAGINAIVDLTLRGSRL